MGKRVAPRFDTDRRAHRWLDYGSYVDVQRRILYVQTPKAACSSLKHMLRNLVTSEALQFNPSAPESRLAMLIHDRPQIPLPSLTAFDGEQLRNIMTGPEWFRFCVIRHPYDRFFSAWRDKVFLCEPGFEPYAPRDGQKFVGFTDFVSRVMVEDDPFGCDPHWRAQVALLLPDDIDYTHVYNLSEIHRLSADLQEHLSGVGVDARLASLPRVNQGLSVSSDVFLTAGIVAMLRQFYQADFERFGFAECEAAAVESPQDAAGLVNEFTDAIFDRNQVIIRHVERARSEHHVRQQLAQRIAELEQVARYQPFGRDAGIRALESRIDALRIMVVEKNQEVEALNKTLGQVRAQLASLRQENDAMLRSTSWRIMAPLRRVVTLWRR